MRCPGCQSPGQHSERENLEEVVDLIESNEADVVSYVARRNTATFRFYAELNDFLEPGQSGNELVYRFDGAPSIKDAIEAQGVPHTEVELIVVNGASVGFGHHLRAGDRIAVYPVFESFDIKPLIKLRAAPLRRTRFVVDTNLGKLARWLRLIGFDTVYSNRFEDAEVVHIAVADRRIVLTRDRRLLHHKVVTHGYWVRAVDPQQQVIEVVQRFQLETEMAPFRRCMACNGIIHSVGKEAVLALLEPGTRIYYDEFSQCADCAKIYWPGSHYRSLKAQVSTFKKGLNV